MQQVAQIVLAFTAFIAAATSDYEVDNTEWQSFKLRYGKSYSNASEDMYRLAVYVQNKAFVTRHMSEYAEGKHSFTVGMNQFGDITNDEFNEMFKGVIPGDFGYSTNVYVKSTQTPPTEIDWRERGAVTPVKDQGKCGSCWSFSSTGALEGAWKLSGHDLVSLSEQQLVDCTRGLPYLNWGCHGGWQDHAYRYVQHVGGIETEETYPYTASAGHCSANTSSFAAQVTSYVAIATGSEEELLDAVTTVGPVAVTVDASKQSFQLYTGGVYHETNCSTGILDHAVLAVGYGAESGDDFWLVKNSWSESWGEQGYIKMARGRNNMCGIATKAFYPVCPLA